ncbi:hypothetical protein MKQ70_00150 [Chitinophaga sedimenti]|uniref:hypothetical protein n=1 Tax=Chitinophaga sedimenti TaxID=2033606 RepID=UPI00200352F5|nr:hypothetical protein [Chitinophaga sedimenti]MCK7553498.1 hypothetical protein [Chitinophaga sedimenti]
MRTAFTIAALLVVQLLHAQGPHVKAAQPLPFEEKMNVVAWLCSYDSVATFISDIAMTMPYEQRLRIGRHWFCLQGPDGVWQAVFGRFANGRYDLVSHYRMVDSFNIDQVCDADTAMLNSHSRAIDNAYAEASKIIGPSQVRFNKFLKDNPDGTLSIWMMPSVQSADIAMYGGEFYYKFDKTGTAVLDRNEYYTGRFRGFKTGSPREIHLDYLQDDTPTLGAMYFAWRNRKVFGDIYIENKVNRMVLSYNEDKGYHWVTTGRKK